VGGRHRTDEFDDLTSQKEQSPRRRAGTGTVLAPLAGSIALAVLCSVAAYVVVQKNPSCSSSDTIKLSVAASPDIHPAVQKVADRFAKEPKDVDGKCVSVSVKAVGSADVANAIAGTGPTRAKIDPDVWIPDSRIWLARLAKQGVPAPKPAGSAAYSPIVMTASKAGAEQLKSVFNPASWTALMSAANAANPDGLSRKIRVLGLDPTQNAAGLGALIAGASVLKANNGGDDLFVGVLRRLVDNTVPTPDSMFATLTKASARVPVGVASEQAVWAHNMKTSPSNPAVALYPAEGTIILDYPIIVRTKDRNLRKAAELFTAELTSDAGRKLVQEHGFRTPDGKGGSLLKPENGVSAKKPAEMPLPDNASINKVAQAWNQLRMGTRLLALLDISGTMLLPADRTGVSRMDAIKNITREGLRLFPDKAEIGTWVFSDNLRGQGVDWKEVVPMGPLGAQIGGMTRREYIEKTLREVKAIPTGNTGLNDTLWAAYQKMLKEYTPDKVSTILLFTDGVGNDDPNGGISNEEILRKLRQAYDPKRPVSILIISVNTTKDEDRAQMTAIAKATGGAAYFPQSVLEIRNIFLKGFARRLCAPNCPGSAQS
jgi:hypothetical protein